MGFAIFLRKVTGLIDQVGGLVDWAGGLADSAGGLALEVPGLIDQVPALVDSAEGLALRVRDLISQARGLIDQVAAPAFRVGGLIDSVAGQASRAEGLVIYHLIFEIYHSRIQVGSATRVAVFAPEERHLYSPCSCYLLRAPEERNVSPIVICFAPNGARIIKGSWSYKPLAPLERRRFLKVVLDI